jgi:hypothetical protein
VVVLAPSQIRNGCMHLIFTLLADDVLIQVGCDIRTRNCVLRSPCTGVITVGLARSD